MGDIVNLNRFRKARARTEKDAAAAENRVRHGRTKAERQLDEAERSKALKVDQHRLEPTSAEATPPSETTPPDAS